jgi:hypothetical protein
VRLIFHIFVNELWQHIEMERGELAGQFLFAGFIELINEAQRRGLSNGLEFCFEVSEIHGSPGSINAGSRYMDHTRPASGDGEDCLSDILADQLLICLRLKSFAEARAPGRACGRPQAGQHAYIPFGNLWPHFRQSSVSIPASVPPLDIAATGNMKKL